MANSIIHKPSVSSKTLYSKSTYQNDIGNDCAFSEGSENKFAMLVILLYVGAYNAANRTAVIIPNYMASVNLPIANGTTLGTINCSCDGNKFKIASSSFSSVFVANVAGYRID